MSSQQATVGMSASVVKRASGGCTMASTTVPLRRWVHKSSVNSLGPLSSLREHDVVQPGFQSTNKFLHMLMA